MSAFSTQAACGMSASALRERACQGASAGPRVFRPAAARRHTHMSFRTSLAGAGSSSRLMERDERAPQSRSAGCQTFAMANQRRVQMVQKQLLRELSTMLLTDKRVRNAVLPAERLGADGTLSTLISVTDVRMSGDLQVAKIYISVFGPNGHGEEAAMDGLQRVEGYIRSQVGKAMGLQRVPELRFYLDDSHVRGAKVQSLLEGLQAEQGSGAAGGDSSDEEDDNAVVLVK